MIRPDKQFCGSIGVRFGTIRMKIELSPAENHGGPAGHRQQIANIAISNGLRKLYFIFISDFKP